MLTLLRTRGPLCLISIAAGWGVSALIFWVLAEAHWQTVLWAFFARLFLILAVACGSLALLVLLVRSMPADEDERLGHLLRWVPLGVLVTALVWMATLESPEVYPGLVGFAAVIGCLLTLDRRVPPSGGWI